MQPSDRRCIRHKKELGAIRDDWEEVYRNSSTRSLFLSYDYVNHWYDCFAAPDQVRVYRVEDAGRTIGFLPLVLNKIMGFRVISSLTNDHSFHAGALVCAGREVRFQELLIQELTATQTAWDMFQNSFAFSFSSLPELLPEPLLKERGLRCQRWVQPTYVARVERPFDIFLRSGISPKERKNFRQYRNRLARAGEVAVRHYTDFEALSHWGTFLAIEGSGWKGQAGSSISKLHDNYQRFYHGLVNLLARNGALHLYFLELNGEPIAGAFCYQDGCVQHYAKVGYKEEYSAFGPFLMLFMHIVEDLAVRTDTVEMLHMFPWDYGYKHRYANEEAFCTEKLVYSKALGGYAAYLLKRVKQYSATLMAHYKKPPPGQP
ncbi:MAG: GNAT family N-acetyltransferase [Veillonellaceae bacterium]|nr:GNAT family N-acetyltransferase [Veillonellaceae bacterium]